MVITVSKNRNALVGLCAMGLLLGFKSLVSKQGCGYISLGGWPCPR